MRPRNSRGMLAFCSSRNSSSPLRSTEAKHPWKPSLDLTFQRKTGKQRTSKLQNCFFNARTPTVEEGTAVKCLTFLWPRYEKALLLYIHDIHACNTWYMYIRHSHLAIYILYIYTVLFFYYIYVDFYPFTATLRYNVLSGVSKIYYVISIIIHYKNNATL